jgi:large subunit ribosomal protein L21
MFSIVEQGGFQYKVSQGDRIRVPLIDAAAESEITLDKVLMIGDAEKTTIGTPVVEGAVVKARILEHAKYRKIVILKSKRRKGYKRKNGHRQDFTKIEITSISA